MERPYIEINGVKEYPAVPKMGAWRKFVKLQQDNDMNVPIEEFMTNSMEIIVAGFNNPNVTQESIEENVDITDILPLLRDLSNWFNSVTFDKLMKIEKKTESGESAGNE